MTSVSKSSVSLELDCSFKKISNLSDKNEISRQVLVIECFGIDPLLQQQRMKRESVAECIKSFAGILKASDGVITAQFEC